MWICAPAWLLLATLAGASPLVHGQAVDARRVERQSAARARVEALIAALKAVQPANAGLAAELRGMRDADQRFRAEGMRLWNEQGVDSAAAKALWDKQAVIDAQNQARLAAIVAQHGWPGVKLVGLSGADAAFLIVDHAPVAYQKQYLPQLRAAAAARDALPMWPAMLEDRVNVNEGRPQRYGTQLHKEPGAQGWLLHPIVDELDVDDRRAEAGFEPLADYVKQFGVVYAPPGAPSGSDPQVFRVQIWGDIVADFSTRVRGYADLRREMEQGLPALTVTDDPAATRMAIAALAARIRAARVKAKQGDIFTPAISAEFRKALTPQLNGATLAAIMDDNPGEFENSINGSYPEKEPLSTVPANILAVLPRLPDDIQYHFLGRHLILLDLRANVILDRIPFALECQDCDKLGLHRKKPPR